MIEKDLTLGCCSICQPGLTTRIVLTTYISLYLCVGLFQSFNHLLTGSGVHRYNISVRHCAFLLED